LLEEESVTGPLTVYGQGYTAPLAIYAALLDPSITEIVLADPPASHADPQTPEFLGILRIGDLPHNLALAYPRPITFVGSMPESFAWTRDVYQKLGAGDSVRVIRSARDWRPRETVLGENLRPRSRTTIKVGPHHEASVQTVTR
jgi:hypothetical protein